jgi:hypothetical protein
MSPQDERHDGDERLRAAFQARRTRATQESCPAAADLWSAVRGEGSLESRRALVDHTSACGACAEAWRLAMDVSRDLASARRPWHGSFAALAAAAALVLALGGGVWLSWMPGHVETPGFRGGEAPVIRSLVREDEALPRRDFRLRWSPGPDGSHYDVRVTTESLQVLAGGQRLAEPFFLVPESALAPLPKDSRILWRVEAALPDGERVASATFVTRLE